MLFIVILVEVLLVAGMAVAVLLDEKKLTAEFEKWVSKKPVVRIPLRVSVVKKPMAERKGAKHRYVHP